MIKEVQKTCIDIKLKAISNDKKYKIIDIAHLYRGRTEYNKKLQRLSELEFYMIFAEAILKVLVDYGYESYNIIYLIGKGIKNIDYDKNISDIRNDVVDYYNECVTYKPYELDLDLKKILINLLKHCILRIRSLKNEKSEHNKS